MKVIIVIFVVGKEYKQKFESIFLQNLIDYCNLHGYELKILDTYIRPPEDGHMDKKKFFWQRLLIPSLFMNYDYVISMDSDIYVNKDAPPLPFHEIPDGKIGAVNERKYFQNYDWRERVQLQNGWELTGKEWHALSGFQRNYHDHINAGFIIYQPKHHASILETLYNENIANYRMFHQDDQSILSVYFIDRDLVHWLDERFNRIWCFWRELFYPNFNQLPVETKQLYIKRFIELNYFTHFTGGDHIEYIPSNF